MFFLSITIFSCQSNIGKDEATKDPSTSAKDSCLVLLQNAKTQDSILMKSTDVHIPEAEKAMSSFTTYATHCKNDSLAPLFLAKAGQLAQSILKYNDAKYYFSKCIVEYPEFKHRGATLFLLAQLYDNDKMLNNEQEAKALYEQIIKEYPNSPFANDSKASINNLGKSDEQLVQEFLKKNK